jgi:hypothetical protein
MNLRGLALVSGVYDLALGLPLLLAPSAVATLFGAAAPAPVVNAQINGVFALALGLGYFWAARTSGALRGYLWIAGVFAKGLGALVFLLDHFVRRSPDSYLLFVATDGGLALLTLTALVRSR